VFTVFLNKQKILICDTPALSAIFLQLQQCFWKMRVAQAVETAYSILNCSKTYAVIKSNVKMYWAAKAKRRNTWTFVEFTVIANKRPMLIGLPSSRNSFTHPLASLTPLNLRTAFYVFSCCAMLHSIKTASECKAREKINVNCNIRFTWEWFSFFSGYHFFWRVNDYHICSCLFFWKR